MDWFAAVILIYTVLLVIMPLWYTPFLVKIFLPRVNTSRMREQMECIAFYLDIPFCRDTPEPAIAILDCEDMVRATSSELLYPEPPAGLYMPGWSRILLDRQYDRQDIFYHELAHHVQARAGLALDDLQAWRAAGHLMMVYHPYRYQVCIMLLGLTNIWGCRNSWKLQSAA